MRFYDLRPIEKLLKELEAGRQPDEKTIREAREAVDREREILEQKSYQSMLNLGAIR